MSQQHVAEPTMEQANAQGKKMTFTYVSYIGTTPEELWEALTSSEFTRKYWGGTDLVTDWAIGSPIDLVRNGKKDSIGTVLEFDPPKRLSYTFRSEDKPVEEASTVLFELTPNGKAVKLVLTHTELDEKKFRSISMGWPGILSNLKSLLERGNALELAFWG